MQIHMDFLTSMIDSNLHFKSTVIRRNPKALALVCFFPDERTKFKNCLKTMNNVFKNLYQTRSRCSSRSMVGNLEISMASEKGFQRKAMPLLINQIKELRKAHQTQYLFRRC